VEKREDLKTAGIRELKEELGADKFRPIAVYKNIYKYNFQKQLIKNQRHSGYRGQKQSLFIAEFIGQDEEIKTNFHDHSSWMWVDSKDFVKQVSKVKKESAELYLQKFKEILELNK
jgi:8-oxo-dGTP pyrophosphatase MutT (NUDIX family)